jgi:hypothetical protein
MGVIIDQVIAETESPAAEALSPRDAPGGAAPALTMEQLRFELRRDADRRARLAVD